jgi:circadian clock protein KaiC
VRGSKNSQTTREYVIGHGGIQLIDDHVPASDHHFAVPQLPFSYYYGLLARSPARHSPVIEEAVAQGNAMPAAAPLIVEPPR